jgi:hypothetical protein
MAHKHPRSHHKRKYPGFYRGVPVDSRMGIYSLGQRETQRRDPVRLKMRVDSQRPLGVP